jgi:hypothetical protein
VWTGDGLLLVLVIKRCQAAPGVGERGRFHSTVKRAAQALSRGYTPFLDLVLPAFALLAPMRRHIRVPDKLRLRKIMCF